MVSPLETTFMYCNGFHVNSLAIRRKIAQRMRRKKIQVCTVATSIVQETAKSNKTQRATNVPTVRTMKITNKLQLAKNAQIMEGHFNY